MLKSRAQHDRSSGEVKTSREHREDLLKQLSEGIWKQYLEQVDDVLIAGDFNQNVDSEPMRKFMRENGLVEVHENVNNIEDNRKYNKHTKNSKQIDTILAMYEIMQLTQESKLNYF